MYSMILGWIGWRFIPPYATKHLLQIIYRFSSEYLNYKPPRPGSQAFSRHYRITYSVVVLGYLFYNLVESSRNLPPNFYQILGVSPDVDDNGLKVAFRQFAKIYHPDRPGVGRDGEALFIMVRDVFEALKNPVVRFAYDRFGPDVVAWSHLSTQREFLRQGLLRSSGYHIVSFLFLVFFSAWGAQSPAKFWRYVLFAILFVFELGFLLYPSPTVGQSIFSPGSHKGLLHTLFPQRVAFQHILFLHQLFLFLTAALTNIAPYLFPGENEQRDMVLEGLASVAGAADREASIMLHTELHSVHPASPEKRVRTALMRPLVEPSPKVIDLLTKEMERMVIERNVMPEAGPLRSVWEQAVEIRRRQRSVSKSGLPSPVSSASPEREIQPEEKRKAPLARLPSPRPSPPPPPGMERRGSGYVRARSVSY